MVPMKKFLSEIPIYEYLCHFVIGALLFPLFFYFVQVEVEPNDNDGSSICASLGDVFPSRSHVDAPGYRSKTTNINIANSSVGDIDLNNSMQNHGNIIGHEESVIRNIVSVDAVENQCVGSKLRLRRLFNRMVVVFKKSPMLFFLILSYAIGLIVHNIVEILRSLFRPRTTIGKFKCEVFLKALFVSNSSYVIKCSRYKANHDNKDYYNAYRIVQSDSESRVLLSHLERQSSFLINLCFVILLYVIASFCFKENILLMLISFIAAIFAYVNSQCKVYRIVWENYYFMSSNNDLS